MRSVNFLHFSDLHLDMPFSSLGVGSGRSSERRCDLIHVFKKIVDIAREKKIELILIGGDLYEHEYVRKSTISLVNDSFASIPNTKVVITPGNHDPYTSDSYYKNYNWRDNVFILNKEMPYIRFDDMGVCVYSAGFDGRFNSSIVPDGIEDADPGLINIFLIHGTVDINLGENKYNSMQSRELKLLGMDYIALGHFHKRFGELGQNGIIHNPGSPEPLGFDEPGEHGVYIGRITKANNSKSLIEANFVEVNEKKYKEVQVNADGCSNDEQLIHRIAKVIDKTNCYNELIRIRLKGFLDSEFKIEEERVLSYFEDSAFFIMLVNETIPDYDFELIKDEYSLRGFFAHKLMSRISDAKDSREKEVLMKALYFGMEALERGEISIDGE